MASKMPAFHLDVNIHAFMIALRNKSGKRKSDTWGEQVHVVVVYFCEKRVGGVWKELMEFCHLLCPLINEGHINRTDREKRMKSIVSGL